MYAKIMDFFKSAAKRKWVRIASWTVLALVVVLIIVLIFISSIVKVGIENIGPLITGVPVKVGSVSISYIGKIKVSLKDMTVGNPKGYSGEYAIKMRGFNLEIAPGSLLSDKVVIRQFKIEGVRVNFETSIVKSNLTDILNNVENFSNSIPSGGGGEPKKGKASKQQKLQVDDLNMSGIMVVILVKGRNEAGLPIPAPPIHLSGLGTGPDGITPAGVIKDLLGGLVKSVSSIAVAGGGEAVKDVGVAVKGVGSTVKDVGSAAGKVVNLFSGDKKSGSDKGKK